MAVAMSKGSILMIVMGAVAGVLMVGTVVLIVVSFLEVIAVSVPFRTHLAASKT